MKIGIDKIGFSIPKFFLSLEDLAISRNVSPSKYTKGLLQKEIAVAPINEDIITLGASAAYKILSEEDKNKIDMIIVATESSIDQSKAASVFIHNLLNLQPFSRAIEIKEACYGATAGLNYAKNYIHQNPNSYVLVIASDIAKYGINSMGEATQGSGSCAMLIKQNPKLLTINNESLCQTRDIMDFWRPNYSNFPIVDGHYSAKQYLESLESTWNEFCKRFNKKASDFQAFCFHLPFSKLGLKGLKSMFSKDADIDKFNLLLENFNYSSLYNQKIGNIYTGSLYLSLLSLIENSNSLKGGDNIGMFSYGSGSVCEIFSMTLEENFKSYLTNNISYFDKRTKISVKEYEEIFFQKIVIDEKGNCNLNNMLNDFNPFILEKIEEHKRIYIRNPLFNE